MPWTSTALPSYSATSAPGSDSSASTASAKRSGLPTQRSVSNRALAHFLQVREQFDKLLSDIEFALDGDSMFIEDAVDEVYAACDRLAEIKDSLKDFADENQFRHIRETDESQPR
jgi:hypothetical protein